MSCGCPNCGRSSAGSRGTSYMYREKRGKSVFTGFVQRNNKIYWVGKNEKTPLKLINPSVQSDADFFMRQMSQYD